MFGSNSAIWRTMKCRSYYASLHAALILRDNESKLRTTFTWQHQHPPLPSCCHGREGNSMGCAGHLSLRRLDTSADTYSESSVSSPSFADLYLLGENSDGNTDFVHGRSPPSPRRCSEDAKGTRTKGNTRVGRRTAEEFALARKGTVLPPLSPVGF